MSRMKTAAQRNDPTFASKRNRKPMLYFVQVEYPSPANSVNPKPQYEAFGPYPSAEAERLRAHLSDLHGRTASLVWAHPNA